MNIALPGRFARKISFALAFLCLAGFGGSLAHAQSGGGRTGKYSQQDIVQVQAKGRYSTLIVLPENEDILDFSTRDKEFWIVNGTHNPWYVHPAQTSVRTDPHLI